MKSKLLFIFLFSVCILLHTASSAQFIAAVAYHCLSVCSDSTVRSWGNNSNGQLGVGDTIDRHTPVQVNTLTGIIAVAGGGELPTTRTIHSLFLKSDSTVWACGANANGQLGDGTTTERRTPVPVTSLTGVVAMAGGQ